MSKTEQAWQRVKDAHDTMMQAYQEYLNVAQEEGVLPKIGHVYHQKKGFANQGKNILVSSFVERHCEPNKKPYISYHIIKNDGIKGQAVFDRPSCGHETELIYKGEYSNDQN